MISWRRTPSSSSGSNDGAQTRNVKRRKKSMKRALALALRRARLNDAPGRAPHKSHPLYDSQMTVSGPAESARGALFVSSRNSRGASEIKLARGSPTRRQYHGRSRSNRQSAQDGSLPIP